MDVLIKSLLDVIEENKKKKCFVYGVMALYALVLVLMVFVPDFGHKGTAIKDIAISVFDVGSSVLSFWVGSKLSK